MAKKFTFIFTILISICSNGQNSLSELLSIHNTNSIPYISVQELAMPKTDAIIFDSRESEEYKVSHLKDAVFVGYNTFEVDSIQQTYKDKNQMIVVYCSLGIRSETIAVKLKEAGYTNVHNLYGGIFEWKNKQFAVYNSEGNETDMIHTFSKGWSKWLTEGVKVYDSESSK